MARRPRITRWGVLALAVCIAAGTAILALARDDDTPGQGLELGVNGQFLFGLLPEQAWPAHLDAMKAAGITTVRYDALWDKVEPTPPANGVHAYNWAHLDAVVAGLAFRGIRWLPIVDYSAPWARRDPSSQFSPPRSNDLFATYARALASRYGRGGSLWRDHPDLPETPVTAYEIWNEPNHEAFWPPAPSPGRYVALYLAARRAIKEVDPDARVVFGGLTQNKPLEFVREAFRGRSAAREQIDAIGYHPYGTRNDDVKLVLRRIAAMRRTLAGLGMADVPIDLTEIGWTTSGPYGAVTDAKRARYYRRLIAGLLEASCGVETVIAHTWVTLEQDPANREHWFGLYRPDGTPTNSARAYREAMRRAKSSGPRRYGPADAPCG